MSIEELPPRVTLAEVADEAGVSLSTISKVLNGRRDVASATRARVENLLEQNGYRRRGNERRESSLLEVVFHELDSAWSMEITKGLENVARENDMSVVLTESGNGHAPGREWISGVLRRRPVGVVLVFSDLAPEHKQQLSSRDIPFVIIDPAGDPSPGVPSVGSPRPPCSPCRIARPRSSRAATCRRSECLKPRERQGSAFPSSSRSSATTTFRWRSGRVPA